MSQKVDLHGLHNTEWIALHASDDSSLYVTLTNPGSGGDISITDPLPVATEKEKAEDEQQVFCKWVNDKVPGATQIVLTDASLVLNLAADRIYKITQFCMELDTNSDSVAFELGCTTGANGTGTFTALGPKRIFKTGASNDGFSGVTLEFIPAIPVVYSEGVCESVTIRVDCNDASASITPGFHGYYKEI